jgi:hypothetical protein
MNLLNGRHRKEENETFNKKRAFQRNGAAHH